MASLDIGTEFFFCFLEGGLDGSETGNVGSEVVEMEKDDGCNCKDDGKLSREETQGCRAVWCSMVILGGVETGAWTVDTGGEKTEVEPAIVSVVGGTASERSCRRSGLRDSGGSLRGAGVWVSSSSSSLSTSK